MRASVLAVALVMAGVWYGPALAQGSIEERLEKMEQRIRYLEERVAAQDRTIVEKDKEISALKGLGDGWFTGVEIGGAVELEMAHEKNYEGDNPNDLAAGTVDLAIAGEVNAWTSAEVALTADDDGKIEIDEWILTLQEPDSPVAFKGGRMGVAFGVYESNMITDPLTKEIGDTADDSIQVELDLSGVTAAAFMFKGDNDRSGDDQVENFGFSAGYGMESDAVSIALAVSWINDIGEAGGFDDVEERGSGMVAGGAASLVASFGDAQVIAEYVAAMEKFKAAELPFKDKGAKPSAWMVQAAYGFELGGKGSTVAIGYEGSQEAQALGLPETQFLVGFSVDLLDNLNLALEWARMQDYGEGAGGSGKSANKATAVLAAEF